MDTLTPPLTRKRLALELAAGLALAYAGRLLIDRGMELATQRFIELIGAGDQPDTVRRIIVNGNGDADVALVEEGVTE